MGRIFVTVIGDWVSVSTYLVLVQLWAIEFFVIFAHEFVVFCYF